MCRNMMITILRNNSSRDIVTGSCLNLKTELGKRLDLLDHTRGGVCVYLRIMHPLPGFNENMHPFFRALHAIQRIREDDTPCEIEKGLYLGSLRAANNKFALISYNVTHILTVAGHLPPAYPRDFVYKSIAISDREDENISQYFDECFNFIEEAKRRGGGVLVHCFAGRSRSVTIVVAYLMKKHGMSLHQAMVHVRSRRPVASPNSGFMSQLRFYEKTLRDMDPRVTVDLPESST